MKISYTHRHYDWFTQRMSMITIHRNQSYPQTTTRYLELSSISQIAMQFLEGILHLGPQVEFGIAKQIRVVIPTMKVKK